MNINAPPINPLADVPELLRRLGAIMAGLAAVVARRFLRNPRLVGLIVPLWQRLTHIASRIERAVGRKTRVRPSRAGQGVGKRMIAPVRLPTGRGWLVRELGYEAVAFALQLEALLTEPAMRAALQALPAAGRVLRPVCRILGVPVAVIATIAPAAADELGVQAPEVCGVVSLVMGGARPVGPDWVGFSKSGG